MTITLELTKGYIATIDDDDADLAKLKWTYTNCMGKHYAKRGGKGVATIYLHRAIMERVLGRKLEPVERVDHKDDNGLNDTRGNIRLCTQSQNLANRGKTRRNKSGFKGVSWSKQNKKWVAVLRVHKRTFWLGGHDNPEDAARAYDDAAIRECGEFARLNFPGELGLP